MCIRDRTITACYEYKRKYFSNIVKVNKKTIPFAKDMNVAVVSVSYTHLNRKQSNHNILVWSYTKETYYKCYQCYYSQNT